MGACEQRTLPGRDRIVEGLAQQGLAGCRARPRPPGPRSPSRKPCGRLLAREAGSHGLRRRRGRIEGDGGSLGEGLLGAGECVLVVHEGPQSAVSAVAS